MARKKKQKTETIGTITVMQQLKMAQEWQGNQRGMKHRSKKDYRRKEKYPVDYDRVNKNNLLIVL